MWNKDREWGTGNNVGSIYRLSLDCLFRIGGNGDKINNRLKEGNFVLCLEHSGDCFYDYIKLLVTPCGVRGIKSCQFGSFALYHNLNDIIILKDEQINNIKMGAWMYYKNLKKKYIISQLS